MMKMRLFTVSLLVSSTSYAAVSIPSAPSSPTGYDEIRTSDGVTCRNSIGGNLQLYGGVLSVDGTSASYYDKPNYDERGGFIGFAYSFGASERLQCSRLAEIETERAQIELARLKAEIATLERIQKMKILEAQGNLSGLPK